ATRTQTLPARQDPRAATNSDGGNPATPSRPTIVVRQQLVEVVDEAEAALAADPSCVIYARGRRLARVMRDGGRKVKWLRRPKGGPIIELLPGEALREALDRSAEWVRHVKGV